MLLGVVDLVCIVFTVCHLYFYQNNIFNFSCGKRGWKKQRTSGKRGKMFLQQSQYDVTWASAVPQQIKIPQYSPTFISRKWYHENVSTAVVVCKFKFNNLTMQQAAIWMEFVQFSEFSLKLPSILHLESSETIQIGKVRLLNVKKNFVTWNFTSQTFCFEHLIIKSFKTDETKGKENALWS